MDIKEVEQYLLDNKYLLKFQGKYHVTSKFVRDIGRAATAIVVATPESSVPAVATSNLPSPMDILRQFIIDSEIPHRVPDGRGKTYTVNAPSDAAAKKLFNILSRGVNYQALVIATKAYYKSNVYKQKVSNFIITGTWESEYNQLMIKFQEGKLEEHIKKQLNTNNRGARKMI